MNTAKVTDTVIKVISYTLVVLAIAGIIGVVAYFTGGFTSGFKTFYLTIDGKDVLTSASGYSVDSENPLVVDVKYVFDFVSEEKTGYSVKVVPNVSAGEDFEFTVDGQKQSFKAQKDLTAGFHIEYGEDSFILTPIGNLDEIIQAVYPTSEIGGCDIPGYDNMFALIVTSYDGSASVTVYFCCPDKVTGVELDYSQIIFPSGTTVDAPNEEVILSDEAVQFRQYVEGACKADFNGAVTLLSRADAEYDKLSEEEKGLPYVATAYKAKEYLGNSLKSGQITAEAREQALAYLSEYKEE